MKMEAQRLENLKYKAKVLSDLNLQTEPIFKPVRRDPQTEQTTKKRRLGLQTKPIRTSARIAISDSKLSYTDTSEEILASFQRATGRSKIKNHQQQVVNGRRSLVPATGAEDIRAGWTKWKATAEPATREDDGTFRFEDFPTFTPNKSPEEMIREGCFGGSYFRPLKSRKLGIVVEDDWQQLPESWYSGLDVDKYLVSATYDADVNKFQRACGQSIEEWEAAGWIAYEHDIRGWFQWYCRFFMGRRCSDDKRQVSRWKKCVGETGRWRRMLLKKYVQMGVRELFDDGQEEEKEVSPVMHQTCHHWAYQVQQLDLDEAWRSSGR
jgi:hypothetical protein